MATSVNHTLTILEVGNDGVVPANELLRRFDGFGNYVVVVDKITTEPTGIEGKWWYIDGTGSGTDWTGNNNVLAGFLNGVWIFLTQWEGMMLYDVSTNNVEVWTGAAWVVAHAAL